MHFNEVTAHRTLVLNDDKYEYILFMRSPRDFVLSRFAKDVQRNLVPETAHSVEEMGRKLRLLNIPEQGWAPARQSPLANAPTIKITREGHQ